jgi:hypothetical protein
MKTENQNINIETVRSCRREEAESHEKSESSASLPRRLPLLIFSGIALWFVFALVMSIGGGYQAGGENPPLALGLTFLIPIIVFVVAYWSSNSLREFAGRLDLRFITAAHVGRIIGFDFLIKYAQGQLPGGFALPAAIGDILTAAMAIPMAFAISGKGPSVRNRFVAWNVFGLVDLFLAVSLGILHSQSSLGVLVGSGPNTFLMSEFPRSLIPTFFVPMFILLHLLALARRNEVTPREPLREVEIQTSLSPYHP